jgi:Icc protein
MIPANAKGGAEPPRTDAHRPCGDTVRIAQLSDPHLLSGSSGAKPLAAFRAVLAAALAEGPDAVVLTGDLADDGTDLPDDGAVTARAEDRAEDRADRSAEDSYAALAQAVAGLPCPVYYLPGNHDAPHRLRRALAAVGIPHTLTAELGAWRLAFLTTALPGRVAGGTDAAELAALGAVLTAGPARPLLVFLHHPPVAIGSPWMDEIGLLDPENLFGLLDRHPEVRALACGHIHQAFAAERRGVAIYGCPSTLVQFRPRTQRLERDPLPPGYRLFFLGADLRLATEIRRLPVAPLPGQADPAARVAP